MTTWDELYDTFIELMGNQMRPEDGVLEGLWDGNDGFSQYSFATWLENYKGYNTDDLLYEPWADYYMIVNDYYWWLYSLKRDGYFANDDSLAGMLLMASTLNGNLTGAGEFGPDL